MPHNHLLPEINAAVRSFICRHKRALQIGFLARNPGGGKGIRGHP